MHPFENDEDSSNCCTKRVFYTVITIIVSSLATFAYFNTAYVLELLQTFRQWIIDHPYQAGALILLKIIGTFVKLIICKQCYLWS